MAWRQRVVVVGAGFGGLAVARGLRNEPVDVLLLDRTNHHLFQPLLYQVATCALSPSEIAVPIRSVVRHQSNVEVLFSEVHPPPTAPYYFTYQGGARLITDPRDFRFRWPAQPRRLAKTPSSIAPTPVAAGGPP